MLEWLPEENALPVLCIVLYQMAVWNACACFALNSAELSCKNLVITGDQIFHGFICAGNFLNVSRQYQNLLAEVVRLLFDVDFFFPFSSSSSINWATTNGDPFKSRG